MNDEQRRWMGLEKLWDEIKRDGVVSILAREAGGAFLVKVVGAGAAFCVHVFLARWMGVRSYGIFTFVWAWITVLVLFGRVGVDKALVRYLPAYREDQQWEKVRGLLQFGGLLVGGVCISLSLIGGGGVWILRDGMPIGQAETFWLGFLILPWLGLLHIGKGVLQAFKRATQAFLPDLVVRQVAAIAGSGVLFSALPGSLTAPQGMGAMLVAVLLSLGVTGWMLFRVLPSKAWKGGINQERDVWLASMVPMMLIAGMHLVLKRTDLIMLGILAGPEAAGTYGAATRVAELSYFGLQSANAIMAPLIAELYHSERHSDLQKVVTWTARGSFGFYLIVATGLIGGGTYVLALFGEAFVGGYGALVILLGGQFANTAAGSVGFLMMMTGHEGVSAKILAVAVVVNVLLNYAFIPIYGLEGAGIATASTTILWNGAMIWYVWRKIGINSTVIARING